MKNGVEAALYYSSVKRNSEEAGHVSLCQPLSGENYTSDHDRIPRRRINSCD